MSGSLVRVIRCSRWRMCRWVGCPRPRGGRTFDNSLLGCSLGRVRQSLTRPQERVDPSPIPVLERGRRACSKSHRSHRERRQQFLEGSIFGSGPCAHKVNTHLPRLLLVCCRIQSQGIDLVVSRANNAEKGHRSVLPSSE